MISVFNSQKNLGWVFLETLFLIICGTLWVAVSLPCIILSLFIWVYYIKINFFLFIKARNMEILNSWNEDCVSTHKAHLSFERKKRKNEKQKKIDGFELDWIFFVFFFIWFVKSERERGVEEMFQYICRDGDWWWGRFCLFFIFHFIGYGCIFYRCVCFLKKLGFTVKNTLSLGTFQEGKKKNKFTAILDKKLQD